MSTFHFNYKETGVKEVPELIVRAIRQAVQQALEIARQDARKRAPVLRGRLAGKLGGYGGISWQTIIKGDVIVGVITATALDPKSGVDYAVFVHEGTGLHGPKKALIRPKKGKVLVFLKDSALPRPTTPAGWKELRKKGLVVYAKHSAGLKPQPFLSDALDEVKKIAPGIFDKQIERLNERYK